MLAAQKTAQEGVVTAAKAVVVGLSEGDAPHSEVVAAKMDLADAEAAVATTEMAIEDAATLAAKSAPLVLVGAAVQTALGSVNTKVAKPGDMPAGRQHRGSAVAGAGSDKCNLQRGKPH